MEEKIRNAKIAIIDRITKAINDTNVKIAPSDLEILAHIIICIEEKSEHKEKTAEV